MPEGTRGFQFDRIMSLHRRAYEIIARHDVRFDAKMAWYDLAKRLEAPSDCWDQVFHTAETVYDANMSKWLAFPPVRTLAEQGLWREEGTNVASS